MYLLSCQFYLLTPSSSTWNFQNICYMSLPADAKDLSLIDTRFVYMINGLTAIENLHDQQHKLPNFTGYSQKIIRKSHNYIC